MNKEQKKFKKVMKERKRRKSYLRRIKDRFGTKLPILLQPFRKSRKNKPKRNEKELQEASTQ